MTTWLEQYLVCPRSGEKLVKQGDYLVAVNAGWAYPVAGSVPILLPTAALPLSSI
ncbi:MAG: hypothetical protein Q4A71_07600 [Actinomycetaceae bacterium]|nr:hypothetical protein [Actinomycetaceae bacterium]